MIKISAFLNILDNIWPYALAVFLFLSLIVIHEFGHFIAAKLMGVRVNEFAVGFGPKLFAKSKGETTYKLNLIPLGGYCAMEGEDQESADDRAFCNKKAWRRFVIVIMGALFNLLLGLIIVAISLSFDPIASTTIAEFNEDAVSVKSGLRVDDEIIKVDSRRIFSTYDLSYAFSNVDDSSLDITVKRDGETVLLKDVEFKTEEIDGMNYISLDFKVYAVKKTFWNFLKATFKTTLSYARIVWFSLIDLISGRYSISAISGPVGVTQVIGNVAKQSLKSLLPIMALITVNLGVFNLLPIPALDGGRLVFLAIEMIIGRPVSRKYEGIIHAVGLIVLLGFMLIVTLKDIIYIWK